MVIATSEAQQQRFKLYGSSDGLTNLNVHALLQDSVGFLWVGTDNGLFRYDGLRFVEYGHTEGLPNTEVHALGQAPKSQQLWIGTTGGLALIDGDGSKPAKSWPELAFSDVRQIEFDQDGKMYLLRASQLLECVTHGENRPTCHVSVSGAPQSFLVDGRSLIFSRAGTLWVKEQGRREQPLDTPGLPVDNWQALLKDGAGNLWVRSNTKLFERCTHCSRFLNRSLGVEHNSEPHLAMDANGPVFVSTLSGAVAFDEQQRVVLSTGTGASDDAVGPLLVDRQGNLWLGMSGGGLLRRLGQGEWSGWRREDGLINNSVWAIRHTRDGALWVGTSAGLTIFDANGKHEKDLTTSTGLPSDRVLAIQPAPTGDVFLGTDPGGLAQLSTEGKLLRVYKQGAGLHGRISALNIDRSGCLWIVGGGGVFRSQPLTTPGELLLLHRLAVPMVTSEAVFRDVLIAEDGSVWIAGSEGLSRFFQGKWQTFTTANGLAANDLDVIAENNGVLWVAYRDALGVSRFTVKGNRLQGDSITKGNGFSSDVVYALSFDHQRRLWATSDQGADVLEGDRWEHFDSSNGLIWNDTNSHALEAEENGAVWIGTSEGMSRFVPAKDGRHDQRFPTLITEVHNGERPLPVDGTAVLSYEQRAIGFRFSSLDFANPPNSFRYRLSGYRQSWVETAGHGVQFEALPAGDYLLEVQSLMIDGSWTSSCRFEFHILAPWWQKWYSLLFFIAGGALCVLACWRLRVKSLLNQKKQLQLLVDQQTNELRDNYDRMTALAYVDQLTSLPNRRRFSEEIQKKAVDGAHLILMLVDLDQFKVINDTYGHDAGDAVLIATANRLQSAIPTGGLLARLGGDEFAVLSDIAHLNTGELEEVCTHIVDGCSQPISFKNATLQISCSIGIAISDLRFQTEDALYKAADIALYEVKRSGRNGYRTYKSGTAVSEQKAVAGELRPQVGGVPPTTSAVFSADGR